MVVRWVGGDSEVKRGGSEGPGRGGQVDKVEQIRRGEVMDGLKYI